MNVLLIEAPWVRFLVDGSERTLVPLGLGYLVSSLEKNGHSCLVVSPEIEDIKEIQKYLSSVFNNFRPQLIGLSSTTDSFRYCIKIARAIKDYHAGIPIVLGGMHSTMVGGGIILRKWKKVLDFVIAGEGEISLTSLANVLEGKGEKENISGLSYYNNGTIVTNPYQLITDIDAIPFPNREKIRQPKKYKTGVYGKNVTIVTSRGCSHNCSFCSVSNFFKHSWRTRSIPNILAEIEKIIELHGHHFYLHFIDDNYFVDKDRAVRIIDAIHTRWPEIVFSFATRSDQLIYGKDCIKHLADSGVVSIELGVENGSQAVLDRLNKRTTVEQNIQALKIIEDAGIERGVDYIFFDHYTDLDDIRENISFLKTSGLWGYYPPLVNSNLTLYYGTPVAKKWQQEEKKEISLDRGEEIVFKEPIIKNIYCELKKLAKYQFRILQVLEKCRTAEINRKNNIGTYRLITKHITLIPYQLLENLYNISDNWSAVASRKLTAEAVASIKKCEKLIDGLES